MRILHRFANPYLIVTAAVVASLPYSSDDGGFTTNKLFGRHASGCTHSTDWQNGAVDSTARVCNNGSSLAVLDTEPLVNKTDCQTLVQLLDGKAGTGHWDIQWDCDGSAPVVLASSQACGFALDQVTDSNKNSLTPEDVIGFIKQAMDMFLNNDTMSAVTGSTECNKIDSQTIKWRLGSISAASSASTAQPRWSWLCLVGTWVAVLSFPRSL
ncbi:unnamed protein product [Discula destructiva]